MTHHDDPNLNRREPVSSETIVIGLVLGGLVGLGVIFTLFMFLGRDTARTSASNASPEPPAASAPATPPRNPATTGQAPASPQPAPR